MVEYSWYGNARVTPWMRYQLERLNADLQKNFGVSLVANSGIRLDQEQLDIWYARYTRTPNGRKVYDTRWWNGQLWYRISPEGTVAQPGTSNHQIQGSKAAVDIADTGTDAGIMNKNSPRGRWLRANAKYYDLVASGDGFGEGWHFDVLNIFNTPPTPAPAPAAQAPQGDEEDEMAVVQAPGGNIYVISRESITHTANMNEVNLTKNISSTTDELHKVNNNQELADLLHGYGIPVSVLDDRGWVLDVAASWRNGQRTHTQFATWSRGIEGIEADRQIFSRVGVKPFEGQ